MSLSQTRVGRTVAGWALLAGVLLCQTGCPSSSPAIGDAKGSGAEIKDGEFASCDSEAKGKVAPGGHACTEYIGAAVEGALASIKEQCPADMGYTFSTTSRCPTSLPGCICLTGSENLEEHVFIYLTDTQDPFDTALRLCGDQVDSCFGGLSETGTLDGGVPSSTTTTPACVGTVRDGFASSSGVPFLVGASSCASSTVSDGALIIDATEACADTPGSSMDVDRFQLCGDFDVQVTFTFSRFDVPDTGASYAGVNVWALDARPDASPPWNMTIERFGSSYIDDYVQQIESYKAYTDDYADANSSFAPGADVAGRFRLQRVGTLVTASYWQGDDWTPLRTLTVPDDSPAGLGFFAGGETDPMKVSFTELSIESGE